MGEVDDELTAHEGRAPSYLDAVTPLIVLALLVSGAVALFGLNAMDGPIQVAMMLSAMVASVIILKNGHSWDSISQAGRRGISSVVSAIFILFAVGALIGTWNASGTIPTLVYYGLTVINPNWFYVTSLLVCALISLGIGSSWTTVGTIGVGLIGLATLAGVSPAITAGAVISGAYTGDKLSPLSETTILAAQLSDNDLYVHLRYQALVSVPGFVIAMLGFIAIGLTSGPIGVSEALMTSELMELDQLFWITPLNLLPLLLLVILSVRKAPASLALMGAALFAGVLACFTQPQAVLAAFPDAASGPGYFVKSIWQVIANGYHSNTGIEQVDGLLSRGGMASMLPTIWLIMAALAFGSVLDEFGFLSKLVTPLLTRARSDGNLIATSVGTAFGLNVATADQYVAVVLPIKLFRGEFERRHLATKNLSRVVSNGGIVTSPLIPWNSCGAFMAAALGVPTMVYAPYAIFNYVSPLLDVLYGYIGFKIARTNGAVTGDVRTTVPVDS
jgi:NhaC family Na+:H+ antiporter